MAKYLVTYDLNKAGQSYDKIETAIKNYGSYCKLTTTTWIVVAVNSSASAIRDYLSKALDANDEIFVATLTGESAWRGLPDEVEHWLRS